MKYTDQQLVEKYLELKDQLTKGKKEFEEWSAPMVKGMTVIENEFLRRLDERGADNTKTDAGTAYKSTITNFTVVDQNVFLSFCLGHYDDCYKVTPIKDPVKEYAQDHNGDLPPGLEQKQYVNVNIRRT